MLLQRRDKVLRQLRPVHAAVQVMDDVVPIIVRPCIVWARQAVIGQLVVVPWVMWVNKDVLAPVCMCTGRAGNCIADGQ